MDVAITGASGFIGTALSQSLAEDGHRPVALVRRAVHAGADEIAWDPVAGTIDAASLEGIDAVVNLGGAGIGDKKWTDARKQLILDSRIMSTTLLAETLAGLESKPAVLVSSSGIGYYGSRGDETLTEKDAIGTDFLAEVSGAWEQATSAASDAGIRVALARTSIVLDGTGGILKKQLPLFKLGMGGRLGDGNQFTSWISLRDQVRAIEFLLGPQGATVRGPANFCTPNPVTNQEFTKTLGQVLGRPTMLPVPMIGPKLLFGSEFVEQLLLTSQRALPEVLTNAGFTFEDPELEPALRRMLDK